MRHVPVLVSVALGCFLSFLLHGDLESSISFFYAAVCGYFICILNGRSMKHEIKYNISDKLFYVGWLTFTCSYFVETMEVTSIIIGKDGIYYVDFMKADDQIDYDGSFPENELYTTREDAQKACDEINNKEKNND